MSWPQVIYGWPTIVLALGVFTLAFLKERSFLGFVGLVLAAPFLWYTSHAPGGLWFSSALFLALGAGAVLLRRGRPGWAAICLTPFVVLVAILGMAVATQG